jgi:predicted hotdog family 3-hydroxylacyl-ACP dehydratase
MKEQASLYIPHTGSMLLVDSIIEHHDDNGVVETTFAAGSMFADSNGVLQPLVFIELLAQGFASLNGYTNHLKKVEEQKGFLVGVKDIQFYDSAPITVGMTLTAKLKVEIRFDDFAMVHGSLSHGTTLLMDGTLKLFIPEFIGVGFSSSTHFFVQ